MSVCATFDTTDKSLGKEENQMQWATNDVLVIRE